MQNALTRIPKKLLDFFDKNMRKIGRLKRARRNEIRRTRFSHEHRPFKRTRLNNPFLRAK
jgi:hypothetical protein